MRKLKINIADVMHASSVECFVFVRVPNHALDGFEAVFRRTYQNKQVEIVANYKFSTLSLRPISLLIITNFFFGVAQN
jgi:hypothetical protein